MYRLLALDVDGTLLDPTGEIRPAVRQAVLAAVAAGCLVTLATGRRLASARLIAQDLGLEVPLILYTGALVYDTRTGHALLHEPLPSAYLARAIEVALEAGLRPAVSQSPLRGERIYLGPENGDDEYTREYAGHQARRDLIERRSYEEIAATQEALLVTVPGPEKLGNWLDEYLPGRLDCNVYSYNLRYNSLADMHGFDLVPRSVSKGKALLKLAEHFGIDPAQTMAIGDNLNDLDLLSAAGLGVAMGNARPELKAVAGAVTSTNAEDGVARAIERYILRNI